MKRREFIQTSMAAAAIVSLPSFMVPAKRKMGLQLWSLRDVIKNDPKGVMKKVAEFGYQEVETFDYDNGKLFGLTLKEFADYTKSLGISVISGHYKLGKTKTEIRGTLLNEWERAVVDAKEIGQQYMVLAYLEPDERKSLDDYKMVCEAVNKGAEICKKYGIRMSYHNHDFEFEKFEGQVAYDLMLKELDPKLVSIELDLYWVTRANKDPLDYFAKYPGRFEQWHVKDMDKNDMTKQVDVGTGRIDFKSIFAKASQAGMKHFYLEQEHYPSSSLESVKNSILNLKKVLK
jgi:sugar phosphate isomerase/epimerase